MISQEIDKLIEDFYAGDIKRFCEKYGGFEKSGFPEVEDIYEAMRTIMMNIEKGDYDYFFGLIKDKHKPLIGFMTFSSKKEVLLF